METLTIVGASELPPSPFKQQAAAGRPAIAIFDPSVDDYARLMAGLQSDIVPYVLAPDADGIQQLAHICRQFTQPLTVYLVAHGAPGTLRLGNTELSLATLAAPSTKTLQSALLPGSALVVYGCNVAAGDAGAEWLAQLRALTGATIAAATRPIGNPRRGGTWELDATTDEMAIAPPFSAPTLAQYRGLLPLPVTTINTIFEDPLGEGETYTANELTDFNGNGTFDLITHTFQSGTENNLIIQSFTAGDNLYSIIDLVDNVELQRVPNPNVTENPEIFWYELNAFATDENLLELKPSAVATLQDALISPVVNRGADNIFANEGGVNVNNIERVDFIIDEGIAAPENFIEDIGFLLLERGGNDPFNIAAITALDETGTPAAYGSLVSVAPEDWGGTGILIEAAVLNDAGTGTQPGVSAIPEPQELSGIFFSFADLGITSDQEFFGYSVFPDDVGTDLLNLSDANTNTSQDSGAGGLDLVAGSAIFGTIGNVPPLLNLDPDNITGGADDRNFETGLSAGTIEQPFVNLTAPNATIIDPDNDGVDVERLTIAVNAPDGADEILRVGDVDLPLVNGATATSTFGDTTFEIAVGVTDGVATVDIVSTTGDDIPNTDIRQLLRSLSYNNTAANRTAANRVFTFVANDGIFDSNTVTSTVALDVVVDPEVPPRLNLDPNNISGGADDANFETNFTIGGGFVNVTAPAATIIDPNNGGVDVETLTITLAAPNGASEVLRFGNVEVPLTDGATATPTIRSTTFEIAVSVTGENATIDIASTTGGDIPNTDIRRLLRSLAYNNTAANPDRSERVLTFVANDGLSDSNIVSSTISVFVVPPPPPPPVGDCPNGRRLKGDAANNVLQGGSGKDLLRGLGGNDELHGRACPDLLRGGADNDRLFGGRAADTLNGGAGRDRLSGQNGADTLFGAGGTDRMNGGRGNDDLFGQAGDDFLRGKAGFDRLRGGQGEDGIAGGAGNDRIAGGGRDDQIFGGGGRDRLRGNARNDRLFGGNSNDKIFGQNGQDVVRGENGRDVLQGNAGNDSLFGGNGNDRLFGGALDDQLLGGTGRDRINGQRGNDEIRGGNQGDFLIGGAGQDLVLGGPGGDRLVGKGGRDELRGTAGRDNISGGAGNDRIFGGRNDDRANGDARNDFIRGNAGADVLFGNAGADRLLGNRGFDRINGGQNNDTLEGGGAADRLIGKAGNDVLNGLAGNDVLLGNNGKDTLIGSAGSDVLIGRADGDTLRGGKLNDRFVWQGETLAEALRDSLVADPDIIVDFDQAEGDRLRLAYANGPDRTIPTALFNAGEVGGASLDVAALRAFRDYNPNRAGNQKLRAREATFFEWRGHDYLLINNANRSFNPLQDLVAKFTDLDDLNGTTLTVTDYFVA